MMTLATHVRARIVVSSQTASVHAHTEGQMRAIDQLFAVAIARQP